MCMIKSWMKIWTSLLCTDPRAQGVRTTIYTKLRNPAPQLHQPCIAESNVYIYSLHCKMFILEILLECYSQTPKSAFEQYMPHIMCFVQSRKPCMLCTQQIKMQIKNSHLVAVRIFRVYASIKIMFNAQLWNEAEQSKSQMKLN